MHRGPFSELGSPIENPLPSLMYREALYQRPGETLAGQIHPSHGPPPSHPSHLSQLPQTIHFDGLPQPPSENHRLAMAPSPPPRQLLPTPLHAPPPDDDDLSTTDSDFYPRPANHGHAMVTYLEWRLRSQSKRLRRKLRAMRHDMSGLYQAVLTAIQNMRSGHSSHTPPQKSSNTALWCTVVGLGVGFVFLLVLLIICWVQCSKKP